MAYDVVLGLTSFEARNQHMDRTIWSFIALRTLNGLQQAKIAEADCISPLPARGEDNSNYEPPPDMQLLKATAFDHLLAGEEAVQAFTIRLGNNQGLLGALLKGITEDEGDSGMLNVRADAAAVVAAEEWHSDTAWMTATG